MANKKQNGRNKQADNIKRVKISTKLKAKSKERSKAISAASFEKEDDPRLAHVQRIQKDIAANPTVLYGSNQTYIHNHSATFLEGVTYANTLLRSKLQEIRSAWEVEAKNLRKLCKDKEKDFFTKMQAELGESIDRIGFQNMLNKSLGNFQLDLADTIVQLSELPEGKKTIGQLKIIVNKVKAINQKLNELNTGDFNEDFLRKMGEIEQSYKEFEDWCRSTGVDDSQMNFNEEEAQHLQGISTRRVMLYILPNTLENLIVAALKKIGTEKIKNEAFSIIHTANETTKGSSADVSMLGTGFSIKMNKTMVKQAKTRIAKTFFDWNDNLNDTKQYTLNAINEVMTKRTGGASAVNILKYIFLNYGALRTIDAASILQDAWNAIILANLNQKLFGYNKQGQQDLTISQVIDIMPVAGITNEGKIVWYADLMDELLTKINNDSFNINSLASHQLSTGFYNNKLLSQAKKKVIQEIGVDNITYKILKDKASSALNKARKELENSIQISLQYHINIKTLIKE